MGEGNGEGRIERARDGKGTGGEGKEWVGRGEGEGTWNLGSIWGREYGGEWNGLEMERKYKKGKVKK